MSTGSGENQRTPRVASSADGTFTVVWVDGLAIAGRRYDKDGDPVGSEFVVGHNVMQGLPADVASNAAGNTVVVWNDDYTIAAQRYDPQGIPQGTAIAIDELASDCVPIVPRVAVEGSGGFVVAWETYCVSGRPSDIHARQYDASGMPANGQFLVNNHKALRQTRAAACSDTEGNFVIVWSSENEGDSQQDVVATRYHADEPTSCESAPREPSPSPTTAGCTGDCSGDGRITIDEVVRGINIALDRLPLGMCPSFDRNGDIRVGINELMQAIAALFDDCP